MIPDEAVEAAAVAYQSIVEGNGQPCWDELPKQRQDNRLYWMRAALEAAAPHMAADAWDEGALAIMGANGIESTSVRNPYISPSGGTL